LLAKSVNIIENNEELEKKTLEKAEKYTNLFISSSSSSHQGNMIPCEAKYGKTD